MQMTHNDVSNIEVLTESNNDLYTLASHVDIKTRLFMSEKHEVLVRVEQRCAKSFCSIKTVQLTAQSLLQNINLQSN